MTETGTDVAPVASQTRSTMPKRTEPIDRQPDGLRVRPTRKLAVRQLQDQESAEQVWQALRYGSEGLQDQGDQEPNPFLPTPEDEKILDEYVNSEFELNFGDSLGVFEMEKE